jgi:hypothetical protein
VVGEIDHGLEDAADDIGTHPRPHVRGVQGA